MFTTLMASAPKRRPVSMSAWGGVSAGVHALLIFGVLWLTSRPVDEEVAAGERVTYLVLPEEPAPLEEQPEPPPPPPEEEPLPPPESPPLPELPAGFQELTAPRVILPEIPPPAPFTIKAVDYSGVGAIGGIGEGYVMEPIDTVVTVEPPVTLAVVDRLPQLIRLDEIARRMQALYPHFYRAAGIEGRAVVQLVVDKEGRVEQEGMTILSTTHPEFGPASLELARLVRFEPARRNGRPVRVWVQLPVDWEIND